MKRIKHNDLTHYFLRPHEELPRAYLASCEKFFKEISRKLQASSSKRHEKDIIKRYKQNRKKYHENIRSNKNYWHA